MKKIIILLLLLLIPFNVYGLELAPNSKSAILVENSTGTVVFEKNSNEKLAPASMTKVMSMLLIMEAIDENRLSLNDNVIISKNASSMGGSQIFLEEGSKMKVEELLKGVAIASGNDAVVALSEKIAGTEAGFVELMNKKAKDLGLKNTNFKNPHGLDEENHYTTAFDMSVMALELLKHESILKYTSIYEEYLTKADGSKTWLVNSNKLVRFYEGIDGLKTGYTENAKYCLTGTGIRNNIRFISVVMGVETSELRSKDTIDLLNHGFSTYKLNNIVKKNTSFGKINIEYAKKNNANVIVDKDYNELIKVNDEGSKYEYKVELFKLKAPIKKGNKVGNLIVTNNKKEIVKKIDLIINQNVEKANMFNMIIKNIKQLVGGK